MLVRTLDPTGDYQLGQFMQNTPAAVAQAAKTRLALRRTEWFLDQTVGTPYIQDILGKGTNYDAEIQTVILGTQGVNEIVSYSSNVTNRGLYVEATIDTIYGRTTLSGVL